MIGDDFTFYNSELIFSSLDRMMEYFNTNPKLKIDIRYSTLSEYFEVINNTENQWPSKSGDFFPYADHEHSYWTGYYTTRPLLKRLTRKYSDLLYSSDKLLAHSVLNNKLNNYTHLIDKLREFKE